MLCFVSSLASIPQTLMWYQSLYQCQIIIFILLYFMRDRSCKHHFWEEVSGRGWRGHISTHFIATVWLITPRNLGVGSMLPLFSCFTGFIPFFVLYQKLKQRQAITVRILHSWDSNNSTQFMSSDLWPEVCHSGPVYLFCNTHTYIQVYIKR